MCVCARVCARMCVINKNIHKPTVKLNFSSQFTGPWLDSAVYSGNLMIFFVVDFFSPFSTRWHLWFNSAFCCNTSASNTRLHHSNFIDNVLHNIAWQFVCMQSHFLYKIRQVIRFRWKVVVSSDCVFCSSVWSDVATVDCSCHYRSYP